MQTVEVLQTGVGIFGLAFWCELVLNLEAGVGLQNFVGFQNYMGLCGLAE
jgi:hypothetical protein